MKIRTVRVAGGRPKACHLLAVNTVAAAVAMILSGAGPAFAQEATSAQESTTEDLTGIDEVVVTGIRHAIESSTNIKKNSDSIVESITAEDIGKLPDVSIAESIARLPGLAAQRVNGRAQVISIRGLAPRYGATLLNGREMVSTGDNRSVELDQFPSELINQATVYKTPDPSLVGQGLSGTLDMATVRPLSFTGPQIALNGRYDTNSNGKLNADSKDDGVRASGSYIGQFADNKLGVALGVAYLDSPNQEKHYKSWWWGDTAVWGAPLAGTPPGSIALQGFEAGAASTSQKRTGVMGVVEFQPTDNLHSMLDLYYSKFDQVEIRRTLMAGMDAWSGVSYSRVETSQVNGDTIVTGGTLDGVRPVALTSFNDRQDDIKAVGWNTQLKMGEWTAAADLSYSVANRDEVAAELQAGAGAPITLDDIHIATGPGRTTLSPSVDFASRSDVLLVDPVGWGRDGRSQFPKVKDELKSARMSIGRHFDSIFNFFETGVNYSERTKDMNRTEVYYYLQNGRAPTQVAAALLTRPTSLTFGGIPTGVVAFDFRDTLDRYYDSGVPEALSAAPGRIWDVGEKITTGYLKLGFAFDTRVPIHGNLGLQAVHADQTSNGINWVPDTATVPGHPVPATGGKAYTDFLPSLNLIFDLPRDTYVRLGIADTMARPNMEDMRAGFSDISVSEDPPRLWSGFGGNAGLQPWRADAYDISVEKYFGRGSYISAAYFYKNLRNFVYSQEIDYDFTGFPNPTDNVPDSNIGTLSTLANGHGGLIAGLELSISLNAELLSERLKGFGVQLNASDLRSSLHEENNPNTPLDGLSGTITNFTVYYEDHGFSARVAQRHRSKFVTTVRGTFGDNVPSAIFAETITDLQLGYDFSGRLEGLSILAQCNNLTDEPYRTAVGIAVGASNPTATLPERYTTYGREYLFGFNYRF